MQPSLLLALLMQWMLLLCQLMQPSLLLSLLM
jgi:hypothetical protein